MSIIPFGLAGEIAIDDLRDQELLLEAIVFPFLEQRLDFFIEQFLIFFRDRFVRA